MAIVPARNPQQNLQRGFSLFLVLLKGPFLAVYEYTKQVILPEGYTLRQFNRFPENKPLHPLFFKIVFNIEIIDYFSCYV